MTAKEDLMRQVLELDEARAERTRIVVLDEVSGETSVSAILERHGEQRLPGRDFDRHFGDLPTDEEG